MQGTSFTFMMPALPTLIKQSGGELNYNVEVTVPMSTTIKLKKSDRPHLFVTAFCLDTKRELRIKKKKIPSMDESVDAIDNGDEVDGEELVWSTTKLRSNLTEGGLKFTVPLDKDVRRQAYIVVM